MTQGIVQAFIGISSVLMLVYKSMYVRHFGYAWCVEAMYEKYIAYTCNLCFNMGWELNIYTNLCSVMC